MRIRIERIMMTDGKGRNERLDLYRQRNAHDSFLHTLQSVMILRCVLQIRERAAMFIAGSFTICMTGRALVMKAYRHHPIMMMVRNNRVRKDTNLRHYEQPQCQMPLHNGKHRNNINSLGWYTYDEQLQDAHTDFPSESSEHFQFKIFLHKGLSLIQCLFWGFL